MGRIERRDIIRKRPHLPTSETYTRLKPTRQASVPTASTSTSQVLSDALACGGYIPGYPNDH